MAKEKLKTFKVKINVDAEYFAEDLEECKKLIDKDFPNLEITDDLEIEEVKDD